MYVQKNSQIEKSAWTRTYTSIFNQCQQKHSTSPVYIKRIMSYVFCLYFHDWLKIFSWSLEMHCCGISTIKNKIKPWPCIVNFLYELFETVFNFYNFKKGFCSGFKLKIHVLNVLFGLLFISRIILFWFNIRQAVSSLTILLQSLSFTKKAYKIRKWKFASCIHVIRNLNHDQEIYKI